MPLQVVLKDGCPLQYPDSCIYMEQKLDVFFIPKISSKLNEDLCVKVITVVFLKYKGRKHVQFGKQSLKQYSKSTDLAERDWGVGCLQHLT